MDALRATATWYPYAELCEYHVDNMAQQLVKNLQLFDYKVFVSTNLFMDIISEQCAGLIGSIGLVYSANLCDDCAMFNPSHGSVLKYKGGKQGESMRNEPRRRMNASVSRRE
ncbi:MAG: isocitrate/isopropylmalate family dehydrogenase [Euryarchaeota archaeon]|nr:isocitrate/isopropylmalate family dehydrogenase [Euryarchaeota archaeon]